ncbi:hypothetical protein R1flu_025157 [Riccia fluitans]|uniref:Uncharacterized protein n=1 Tax=Riccia fluitans TaxID=41844 RepID=A0ABD1XXB7_9MARC
MDWTETILELAALRAVDGLTAHSWMPQYRESSRGLMVNPETDAFQMVNFAPPVIHGQIAASSSSRQPAGTSSPEKSTQIKKLNEDQNWNSCVAAAATGGASSIEA